MTWDKWLSACTQPLSAALACLAVVMSAQAACGKNPECDAPTGWSDFTAVALEAAYGAPSHAAKWRGEFDHKTMDLAIHVDVKGPDGAVKGIAAMVGGRVMVTKGMDLPAGYEIDVLDAPVLSMRLAMIVLGRVFPEGPAAVRGKRRIDRTDKVGIQFATPSAGGYIPAPWKAKGTAEKLRSGAVAFDITLTFPAGKEASAGTQAARLKGTFSMLGRPVFSDGDSLEGWKTYGVGPQVQKIGGNTILDYGAKPDAGPRFRTVGDVRAYIAEQDHPGTRDRTKDFTGFWKEKCEEAFGLQIKPFGDDGKYSVVFCGPGGCGDPADSRKTFITGDRRYEVVSEDEIVEIDRSGERERYVRCTRETNPVLKY